MPGVISGLALAAVLLLLLSNPMYSDGDPLEEYDFTGEVPLEEFLERPDNTVFRHGLWTVQHVRHLDPFGGFWALEGNGTERVNVYYGTRPLWRSSRDYRVTVSSPPDQVAEPHAFWNRADGSRSGLPITDTTGGNGMTLWLTSWNGDASGGTTESMIRLEGDTPADAEVRVLFSGCYSRRIDLDGDGVPEIVDFDPVHYYAEYMVWKGCFATVVLSWDERDDRYRVANDRLLGRFFAYAAKERRERDESVPTIDPSDWAKLYVGEARKAIAEYVATEGDFAERETARTTALLTWSAKVTRLIWGGRADLARQLLKESPIKDYSTEAKSRPGDIMKKDEWWLQYRRGCATSKYWAELCRVFPDPISTCIA